jgi:hypothetical protein
MSDEDKISFGTQVVTGALLTKDAAAVGQPSGRRNAGRRLQKPDP